MIDGNEHALREYERRQDAQDIAWESVEAEVKPLVKQIGELVAQALDYAEFIEGYDFEDTIIEMIKDEIELW